MNLNQNFKGREVKKYYGGGGLLEKFIEGVKRRINDPNQPRAWGYSTPAEQSATPRDYSFMKGGTRQRTAEEQAKWEAEVQRQAALQKQYGAKPGPSRITRSTSPKFQSRLGELNLNDDEKAVLAQHGVTDFNNATQIQNAMLALAPNANLGAKKGAGVADGYFGNQSLEAFQALRRSGVFVPKVDAQEPVKPVSQTPVDAPDFGYKSEGNYSADQAETLKTNGIRDWSSLVNYAGQNKDSDFTKLLSGYFGTNDITQWDRKKFETDAKVHGGYHGQDRSQIQGFLGGLQARNNQQYYDKVAAYAKQNPTPTTSRFDFSKISKLKAPEFKFNLSSAGASTLGNNMGLV